MGKLVSALKNMRGIVHAMMHTEEREKLLKALQEIDNQISDNEEGGKKLKSLAISKFSSVGPVERILGLKDVSLDTEPFWKLRPDEVFPLPSQLTRDLESWNRLVNLEEKRGNASFEVSESIIRLRVNSIMRQLLLWENRRIKKLVSNESDVIWMTTEPPMKFEVYSDGENLRLNGNADYAIWYERGTMDTNMIVVETKKYGKCSDGLAQCLAYAGIVHRQRKKRGCSNSIVFGVATDSFDFMFIKIKNNSEYTVWRSHHSPGLQRDQHVWSILVKMFTEVSALSPRAGAGRNRRVAGYQTFYKQEEFMDLDGK